MEDIILQDADTHMQRTIEILKDKFSKIQSGKPNPQLFQNIQINYYNTLTPLGSIAAIKVQGMSVIIEPYDASALKEIEISLLKDKSVEAHPNNDGSSIRLNMPELTQEKRQDYVKQAKKAAEDARISIRNIRRKAKDEIALKEKEAGKDEVHRYIDLLDKLTHKNIESVDKILHSKEEQLLHI